jgi:hypothetical protein
MSDESKEQYQSFTPEEYQRVYGGPGSFREDINPATGEPFAANTIEEIVVNGSKEEPGFFQDVWHSTQVAVGAVSGAGLAAGNLIVGTLELAGDVLGTVGYGLTGGMIGEESKDDIVNLGKGLAYAVAHPINTAKAIGQHFENEADGALREYEEGNYFTAGVVAGKSEGDIYMALRTLPELAAQAGKLGRVALENAGSQNLRLKEVGAVGNLSKAEISNAKVVTELSRLKSEGHALERHGGSITDVQLVARARTGKASDGSISERDGQIITPNSTAFNSDKLLIESDLYLRQNYLDRAITLATNQKTGKAPKSVTIEGVDMNLSVGRGYEAVGKNVGLQGPLKYNSDLSRVTAVYKFDAQVNKWKTVTIYPVK